MIMEEKSSEERKTSTELRCEAADARREADFERKGMSCLMGGAFSMTWAVVGLTTVDSG
jgi:hypothetical protein